MSDNSILSKEDLLELGFDGESMADLVANAANKALADQVKQKERIISEMRNTHAENEERINAMYQHLKNVRQELTLTQALYASRKKEWETEDHFKKISDREFGRLQQELKKMQIEMAELKERQNANENNKFRKMQQLEETRTQMDWDQQALQAWLEEAARKDEDAMIIEKYSRQDDAKIKELNGRMGHLVDELQKKKRQLDHEFTETQMTQMELDNTATEFRKAHAERQELLSRWQDTINQMQKRDNEMELLAAQLGKLRAETRKREAYLKEKEEFYNNEVANNKETEKKIEITERQNFKLKQEYQDMEKERDRFNSELDVLKRTVDRTASDLESTRAQLKELKREYTKKTDQLNSLKQTVEKLQQKLKDARESRLSAEERSVRMAEAMKLEERNQAKMIVEVKELSEALFKRNNELGIMRNEQRALDTEMQGMNAAMRSYNSKIIQLDQESLKQLEIMYNQNFNIQSLERRISKLTGEGGNSDEVLELEARVKELTAELKIRADTHNLLDAQIKQLQDDLRRKKFSLERISQRKIKISEKIDDLNLQLENAGKEGKKIVNSKQNLMVEENVMKLEVKRKRDALYKTADDVMSMEKVKLQMEAAMRERREEIKAHVEMLNAQIRGATTERQTISTELHERIFRIDKLKNRYEIMMISMQPPEGDEERSQAFYVIKAAQEKEELQREGDRLDALTRKAEKELQALENTVRLLCSRNESFRRKLNPVGESSDEMEQKQRLEEELRAVNDKYRFKRRQIQELHADLELMNSTMENLRRDEQAYNESVNDKQTKILRLQKDLEEQKAKLDRVTKLNTKFSKDVRCGSAKPVSTDEQDFEIRVRRDLTKRALKELAEVAQQYPELAGTLHLYLNQANIQLPSGEGCSTTGSAASRSTASSTPSLLRSGSMLSDCSTASSRSSRAPGSDKKPASAVVSMTNIGGDLTGGGPGSVRSSASSTAGGGRNSSRKTTHR